MFLDDVLKRIENSLGIGYDEKSAIWQRIDFIIKKIEELQIKRIGKITKFLNLLTDEERLEIFLSYCVYCGSKDTGCQCWNDE